MCGQVMSAARARCGACGALIEVAYEWCDDDRGIVDTRLAAEQLRQHARTDHPERFGLAKHPITPAPRRPQ